MEYEGEGNPPLSPPIPEAEERCGDRSHGHEGGGQFQVESYPSWGGLGGKLTSGVPRSTLIPG